jgi:small subunit ribosomal protein S20
MPVARFFASFSLLVRRPWRRRSDEGDIQFADYGRATAGQRIDMANTPQARKRIRRNERRAIVNGNRISRIRTFLKKVELALEAGDKEAARTALSVAQPELARGVARGAIHKNTASRKMSRLSKRVSAL